MAVIKLKNRWLRGFMLGNQKYLIKKTVAIHSQLGTYTLKLFLGPIFVQNTYI